MIKQPSREYYIPTTAKVVFVQDFFATDLLGGAELTSDAIVKACPVELFEIHSSSLTEAIVTRNKDKLWVFGNQTLVPHWLLAKFIELEVSYSFFEYDWKPCIYRSTIKHEKDTGKPCECHLSPHGQFIAHWMSRAKAVFWCSGKQRDKFTELFPGFKLQNSHVQASTFYPETIRHIKNVRSKREQELLPVSNRWVVLDSDSWIKGTSDAVALCRDRGLDYTLLKGLSNQQFIEELAKSKGMVFLPRDMDVGSRTCIEAKLLGCELVINDFVLPKFEPWFNQPVETIEEYFLSGPERFWNRLMSV